MNDSEKKTLEVATEQRPRRASCCLACFSFVLRDEEPVKP